MLRETEAGGVGSYYVRKTMGRDVSASCWLTWLGQGRVRAAEKASGNLLAFEPQITDSTHELRLIREAIPRRPHTIGLTLPERLNVAKKDGT